jgi:hypothetical protein
MVAKDSKQFEKEVFGNAVIPCCFYHGVEANRSSIPADPLS